MSQYLVGEKKRIATSMKWMPTEKAYLADNLLTKFSWFRIKREPWVAEVVLRPESPGGCRCPRVSHGGKQKPQALKSGRPEFRSCPCLLSSDLAEQIMKLSEPQFPISL